MAEGHSKAPHVHVIDAEGRGSYLPHRHSPRRLRLLSVLGPSAVLLVWEVLALSHRINPIFFPAPTSILMSLVHLIGSGVLLTDLWVTLWRVVLGFALGALVGVLVGLLLGLSEPVRAFLYPVFASVYPIPKIAILPLVMLIFGMGSTSKVAVVAISVFFLLLFNTLTGVLNIPRIYLDVGRNFGARGWDFYRTIALPGALPLVFTGLKLGIGVGLIVIVAAEFVAANHGLGYLIWQSWQTFQVGAMYVGLALVSILGFILALVFDMLERRLVPWRW